MPYIKQEIRDLYEPGLRAIAEALVGQSCGDLNYLITRLCLDYLARKGEKYQTYNDITGALENAKLEFYRRRVIAYEQSKIDENGDVY